MDRVAKPNGYWTLDRLMKEASKYKTRKFINQIMQHFVLLIDTRKTEILASLEALIGLHEIRGWFISI